MGLGLRLGLGLGCKVYSKVIRYLGTYHYPSFGIPYNAVNSVQHEVRCSSGCILMFSMAKIVCERCHHNNYKANKANKKKGFVSACICGSLLLHYIPYAYALSSISTFYFFFFLFFETYYEWVAPNSKLDLNNTRHIFLRQGLQL